MKKRMSDRNPLKVAVVGIVVIAAVLALALNLNNLPLVSDNSTHHAYLANASGLAVGDQVEVHGVRVGQVTGMHLQGNKVVADFTVGSGTHLGSQTSAAVKVLSALGTEYLALTPAGEGSLSGPIPLERTQVSTTLLNDLGTLTNRIQTINLPQLEKALDTGTSDISGTSAASFASALSGLERLSQVLANDRQPLADIVTQGDQVTQVLNQRNADLINLVNQSNELLPVLRQRQADIKSLLSGTSSLSAEINSILEVNQATLGPMLANVKQISDILSKDDADISAALPALAQFSNYAANATGSGPFLDVIVPTGLLPDNVIAQCSKTSAYPKPSNPSVGCRP